MLRYAAKKAMEKEEVTLFILVLSVICPLITKLPDAGSTEFQFGFETNSVSLCMKGRSYTS